ncbi:hypothetical protein [Aeoliella mucimassa]|uniref:hypothetical protein n=1 Tax=Aeoliella mucimassa TaxID=2527972 RepID=UPI00119D1CDE|nr:hypothetical protein [Aeoliella mucimassa]
MARFKNVVLLTLLAICAGCGQSEPQQKSVDVVAKRRNAMRQNAFVEARKHFTTQLIQEVKIDEPVDQPPEGVFDVVSYPSPLGKMAAYVTPDFEDGKKHPAIIWLTGGFSNSIGANAWYPSEPSNDQSAMQYRRRGW